MPRKAKRRTFGTIMTDRRRPGHFYVRFPWTDGRLIKRYGGPSRQLAAERLSAVHALKVRGASLEEVLSTAFGEATGARLSFREAAPLYLEYAEGRKKPSTFKRDVARLRTLCAAPWASKHLGSIRPEDLARYAASRETAGISGPTINRELAMASALFKWAILMGYVEENPVRRVPRYSEAGRERETYLTAAESRALIAVAEDAFRPLLSTALHTGMRKGELLPLAWRDVDFERGEIVVRPTTDKAGRGRTIPMAKALARELAETREERKVLSTAAVFAMPNGRPIRPDRADGMLLRALAFCEAIPEEKKPKVTFHTLRHTAASLMVQAGVNWREVMRIFGWTTMAMVMRYAHFAPEAGRDAVDRLGAAFEGPSAERAQAR